MRLVTTILYRGVLISCIILAGALWLPASVWIRCLELTVHPDVDQSRKISALFFNPYKLTLYKSVSIFPLGIAALMLWKRIFIQTFLYEGLKGTAVYIRHLLHVQSALIQKRKAITVAIFILPALVLFKYAYLFPFTVDEAFSWVHLVNKGPVVSALYYPAPNNHIFYTVVCSFFNYLPLDPVWIMRIPTVLAYLCCIYIVYLIFTRLLDNDAGMMATCLFSIHPSMVYYALHGRGYMFLVLFVLLSAWFLYSALINKVKYAQVGFVFSAVLGFYTIPVFLYYFILLGITIFMYIVWNKEWKSLREWICIFISVTVLTTLLYLPVILMNGWDALANNVWVQPQPVSLNQLFQYGIKTLMSITAYEGLWVILTLMLGLSFMATFYFEKEKLRWLVWTIFLWIPLLLLILYVQQLMPFERIWIPFSLLWIGGLVWLEAWLDEVANVKWLGAIIFFITMFFSILQTKNNFAESDPYYNRVHGFVEMIDPKEVSSVYSAEDTYLVMLQVKFAQAGKEAEFTTVNDLHGKNADLRIVPLYIATQELVSPNEEAFYANTEIVAYRRKGLKILR